MKNVYDSAVEIQRELPREIMAHKLAAEHHRKYSMILGGLSTFLTTLVGTAIFTGLVSQLGMDGTAELRNPFQGQGMQWGYLIVMLLSVLTPIVAALHTFMHHAEDASTHRASAEGYTNVLRRFTTFLTKYEDFNSTRDMKNEAAGEYDEIMIEYCSILGKSLTLTRGAYRNADKRLKKKENGNGAETSKS